MAFAALQLAGLSFQPCLALVTAFVLWRQLQSIWRFVALVVGVVAAAYFAFLHRSNSKRIKMKDELAQKDLLESYLIECDQFKMILNGLMIAVFCYSQVALKGFLLEQLVGSLGGTPSLI